MLNRIKELAKEYKQDTVEFSQRIIRIPSLTGQEKEVADEIYAEMEKLGYEDMFRDEWGNIVGFIHGTEDGPTIMYNGHMDHVDTGNLDDWGGYDPYGGILDIAEIYNETGTELEMTEVVHGRAAADTKCGIACMIYSGAIIAQLKKEGYKIKGHYMIGLTVMEEPAEQIGMIGLYDHELPKRGIKVDGVVSCESTSLKIYCGHRGRIEINVEVQGLASHGASPWLGINAVNKATQFIDAVEKKYSGDVKSDEKVGKSTIALTVISCLPGTMCVVPDRCMITFDRRLVPGEAPETALQEIQDIVDEISAKDPQFHAKVSVSTVPRTTYTGKTVALPNIKEGWRIPEDHPYVVAASNALRNLGEPVSYGYWDFGTDLAMISGRHKVASIGYSPMQEYYCHRPVDRCRTDFMERALAGNISIFNELAKLEGDDFKL